MLEPQRSSAGGTIFAVEAGANLRAPKGATYAFTANDDSVLIEAAARTFSTQAR